MSTEAEPIDPTAPLRLVATVMMRDLGDEKVLLDLANDQHYTVSGVGTFVAELLQEQTTLGDVVVAVLAEFEVDEAVATADVEAFVARLGRVGLLDRSS